MLPLREEQIEPGNEIDSWSIAAEYHQCHGEDDNTKSKCHEQKSVSSPVCKYITMHYTLSVVGHVGRVFET